MRSMKAVCVTRFYDLEKKVMREAGEEFDCTAKRLEAINATKYGKLAEKVTAKKEEEEE